MFNIKLTNVTDYLSECECMEIINELAFISGVTVHEVSRDDVAKFILANMENKNEIVLNDKHYYESSHINDITKVLINISDGLKHNPKIFLKIYNGKIEKCKSPRDELFNIICEYYHGQNKIIIEKVFMRYIRFC